MNDLLNKFKNSRKATLWLILVFFILINWVSYSLYLRSDLSATGRFKLTSASKKILRQLPEKATIEAYFSSDISEAYVQPVKQLRDFLQEYAASSRGRVKLVFLNPDEDEKIQQKARSLGIQPMPIGSVDRKKREVSKVYLSLAISYEDKSQVVHDILRQSQALEYFLTANIYKMAYPGERTIGILETDSDFSKVTRDNPFHSIEILEKSLSSFYGDMEIVRADSDEVPGHISILVMISPKKLTDSEKYHIDQFIMRGGKVILASGGLDINFNNLMANPKNADTLAFFQNYGIDIKPDMIFDAKNYIPFRQPVNMIQMIEFPYPVWLASPKEYLAQDSLMTENFQYIVFPWASSLSIDQNKIKEAKITELATSSLASWTRSDALFISPDILKNALEEVPEKTGLKKYGLAYHVKGKFHSYFKNKPLPANAKNFISENINFAEFVVVSSPYTFTNNIQPIQITQNLNINFFLSILDVMNGLEDLVRSRNRSQAATPVIGPIDSLMKNLITVFNLLLPLVFIVGYALVRYMNRKKIGNMNYVPGKNEEIKGDSNG